MNDTHQDNCITWRNPDWPCSCKPASEAQVNHGPAIRTDLWVLYFCIAAGFLLPFAIPLFVVVALGAIIYMIVESLDGKASHE